METYPIHEIDGAPEGSRPSLRAGRPPVEPKLAALINFSRVLVKRRGEVSSADLDTFLQAGYSKAQALEVILGVAVSVLPNFAHHLTDCPIDEAFHAQLWEAPAA